MGSVSLDGRRWGGAIRRGGHLVGWHLAAVSGQEVTLDYRRGSSCLSLAEMGSTGYRAGGVVSADPCPVSTVGETIAISKWQIAMRGKLYLQASFGRHCRNCLGKGNNMFDGGLERCTQTLPSPPFLPYP